MSPRRRDPLKERNGALRSRHGGLARGLPDLGDRLLHPPDRELRLPAGSIAAKASPEFPGMSGGSGRGLLHFLCCGNWRRRVQDEGRVRQSGARRQATEARKGPTASIPGDHPQTARRLLAYLDADSPRLPPEADSGVPFSLGRRLGKVFLATAALAAG